MNNNVSIKNCDFYDELRALPFVRELWLYGSRARGTNYAGSDVDLVVVCPQATDEEWKQVQSIIRNTRAPFKIDLIRLESLPNSDQLRDNILKDHKILFKKQSTSYTWYDSFFDLGEALERLEETINVPEHTNPYVRDAAVLRFEFCVESFWKTLKRICISLQYDVISPREVIEKSFEINLIDSGEIWHAMLDDRNLASHVYKNSVVREIYYRIDTYYKYMKWAYDKIKEKYNL